MLLDWSCKFVLPLMEETIELLLIEDISLSIFLIDTTILQFLGFFKVTQRSECRVLNKELS